MRAPGWSSSIIVIKFAILTSIVTDHTLNTLEINHVVLGSPAKRSHLLFSPMRSTRLDPITTIFPHPLHQPPNPTAMRRLRTSNSFNTTIKTWLVHRPSFWVSVFCQLLLGVAVAAFVSTFAQQAFKGVAKRWNIVIIVGLTVGVVSATPPACSWLPRRFEADRLLCGLLGNSWSAQSY